MGDDMNKKLTKETTINVISSIALGSFLMYLSRSFGELITVFLVFPFLVIFLNEGWKLAVVSIFSTVAISSLFLDIVSLVYMASFILGVTFFAGIYLSKKKQLGMTILYASFIKLALLFLLMAAGYYYTKTNPIEVMRDLMYKSVEEVGKTLEAGLEITKADIDKFVQTARDTVDTGIEILPAILFMISYLGVAINILLGLKIAKKSGNDLGYKTKLNEYSPDRNLRFASLIIALVCFVLYIMKLDVSRMISLNLVAILSFFYFIFGFLLSDYIYEKSGRKIIRIIMPILIIVVLRSFMIYVFIGVLDVLFNFRERMLINGKK